MNIKELKQLADLYGFIVKPEKRNNKVIFHWIFNEESINISLWAMVWNINNYKHYKKYTAQINIEAQRIEDYNYSKLKFILLKDILLQVIKNNIIMI